MKPLTRREALGTGLALAGSTLWGGCSLNKGSSAMTNAKPQYQQLTNKDFYKADGSFDTEKARQAYYDMMAYFNYPIVDRLKGEEFWAIDFGLGRFAEVGMAGIFWVNNQRDGYFGHEIYLLPGQRITEHAHVKTDAAGPKMEAWQPRHGFVYISGEGDPTPGAEADIPAADRPYWIAKTRRKLLPGEIGTLDVACSKHWMMAGPEGAIVTEYATYHDNDGLRFSNPNVKF